MCFAAVDEFRLDMCVATELLCDRVTAESFVSNPSGRIGIRQQTIRIFYGSFDPMLRSLGVQRPLCPHETLGD